MSFIQDSADSLSTSHPKLVAPWITLEIRRKIRRRNETHAKAKKNGSKKFRSKYESLRREINFDVRKQFDLYVNYLVGDTKANPREETLNVFHLLNGEEILALQIQKLIRLMNLMVSLRTCSTKMNTARFHFFSEGRPLSWMTLLFQKRKWPTA